MNRALILAASILFAFVFASSTCNGKEPQGGIKIAVVDADQLYLRSSYYAGRMKEIADEVEAETKRLEELERQKIHDLVRRLELYKKGSPEFRAIEEEFGQCRFQVAGWQTPSRRTLQHECAVYTAFLTDLREEVAEYANEEGIGLVLRFRRRDLTPGSHEEIHGSFMHVSGVDVTDAIESRLQARNALKSGSALHK